MTVSQRIGFPANFASKRLAHGLSVQLTRLSQFAAGAAARPALNPGAVMMDRGPASRVARPRAPACRSHPGAPRRPRRGRRKAAMSARALCWVAAKRTPRACVYRLARQAVTRRRCDLTPSLCHRLRTGTSAPHHRSSGFEASGSQAPSRTPDNVNRHETGPAAIGLPASNRLSQHVCRHPWGAMIQQRRARRPAFTPA